MSRISFAISTGRKSSDDQNGDCKNGDGRGTGDTNASSSYAINLDVVNAAGSDDDDDDDSFNSEDDLRRIEEAIAQRGENVQRSSVTFTTSTKNFDGTSSPEK